MKHNWKKILYSMTMVICLLISLVPVPVYADPEDTAEKVVFPEDAIYLVTVEDVLVLAENCIDDDWSVGKTVVLQNDIDMTGVEFYGIPTYGGTFYGQGYTISGIKMEQDMTVMGFFRYIQKKAVVDDLHLEVKVTPDGSADCVGAMVGVNNGTIKNCSVKGTVSGMEQVGGIAGHNKTLGIIENCTVEGMVSGEHYIGGLVGENQGVIRYCTNLAEVNTQVEQNTLSMDMTSMSMDMSSMTSNESMEMATNIGGIAGTSSGTIRECVNKADVGYKKMGYNVGGICGSQIGYMVDCINYAQINGSDGVGGIVGQFKPNVVLDFGENPMDTMSREMKRMRSSMEKLVDSMEGTDYDTGSLEDAMEGLENPEDFDADAMNSLMNDLSNSFNDAYNNTETSNNAEMTEAMDEMMNSMNRLTNTMSSMKLSMGMEINDISRNDKEKNTIAKAYNCSNYGNVYGETYVGGIAGLADIETTSMQDDMETKGDMGMNSEVTMRLVIRDCRNYATIAASKEYAGGIVGNMVIGAIFNGMNTGNLDALNADYVGGIAGGCDTIILDSFSKCIMAGSDYVGGIAGFGTEAVDSYAFADIAAYSKWVGGIFGNTEVLPVDDDEELVTGNYYYLVGKDLGGIDGINYDGATARIALEDYLALEELDEMFKNVEVRFTIEGEEDVVLSVPLGESLAVEDAPVPTLEANQDYSWEFLKPVTSETLAMGETEESYYLSEARLTNILFDQIYEVEYEAKHMVIQGKDKTEDNHSIILAIGAFDKGTSVEVTNMISQENLINEVAVKENWQVSISNIGVEKLHYRIPTDMEADAIQLFVKDVSGTWVEREYTVEGSYIVFAFAEGETGFALAEAPNNGIYVEIVVVAVAIILLFVVIIIKRKQKVVKKGNKE